jgi:ABC-type uncharacterized transport system substrate-binding protein
MAAFSRPTYPTSPTSAGSRRATILKGEKPGDLPVQAPTKYETVLNLKAAKALSILATAEVIE